MRNRLIFGMAFVVAIGSAVITNANSLKTTNGDQAGFQKVGTLCSPTNVPDNCTTDNAGPICTSLHLASDCSDVLRMPEQ